MTLTALQTVAVPSMPDPQALAILALVLVAFLAGMTVPTRFGIERMEGFGRFVAAKVPYQPPPGMDEKEAMQQATERAADESDGEEAQP